ncbi:MAG: HDOD domain-containing protein [Candidatus Zixiibacteriota bacterium]|nr:MAG: HDOD domain-containing protein [candidate division Zixibacteria bacterium]
MMETSEATEKKLKLIIDKIHNLPTPPIVFTQITKVINNPNTSAYEIGAIIAEDPALTAKVLKLTNSSYYGISRTITNVKQAIVILGLEAVKSLVISASVFEAFSKNSALDREYLENFWRHSLSAAFMAKIVSRFVKRGFLQESEIAFSGGLLHDIGKLIIISHLPEEYSKIKTVMEKQPSFSEIDIESSVLQFTHSDLGSYMASKWNLPGEICFAILNHHSQEAMSVDSLAAIIHLADQLAHKNEIVDDQVIEKSNPFHEEVWEVLGLDPTNEVKMLELLRKEYTNAETFIKMAQGTG